MKAWSFSKDVLGSTAPDPVFQPALQCSPKSCGPVKFSFGAGGGDRDIDDPSFLKQGQFILQASSI